jgi:thioredoxin-dependent peroxiredoxin
VHRLLVFGALVACGKPVDDDAVLEYLRAKPADARAALIAQADPRQEQPGVITRGGAPLTLLGAPLAVGAAAPAVALADPKLATLDLGALRGKLVVLSVVPSIDTRVCEAQTHHVSDAIAKMPPGTTVITVSRDLPFAQGRFAEEAMTQTQMGSDYRGGAFGRAYGLEVKETGLLARSVWVIKPDGTIAYREVVADQATEPNYDALLAAVQHAAGT